MSTGISSGEPQSERMDLAGGMALALAAAIWGGMYVVSKAVLAVIPPIPLVCIRYGMAIAVLAAAGWTARVDWRVRRGDWPLVLTVGAVGYAGSISLQFLGTAWSTAQAGAVVTASTPAFMVIFARVLLGERVGKKGFAAVALATLGVWQIANPAPGAVADAWRGDAALVLAALLWALMSVLIKRVPPRYPAVVVTTYAMGVGLALLLPFAALQWPAGMGQRLLEPGVALGVAYLGLVSTAVAFFLWTKGLQWKTGAGKAGLYFFFQPLTGALLGWILLGERAGPGFWLGAGLIAGGVALSASDGRRAPERRPDDGPG